MNLKIKIEYNAWCSAGKPPDRNGSVPANVKRYLILELLLATGSTVFVETGTQRGDTTAVIADFASVVHTVEAYAPNYQHAKTRFRHRKNIFVHLGNSAEVLPSIIEEIGEARTVFWLDAHYSGPGTALLDKPTPILDELDYLAKSDHKRNWQILIDDARGFGLWEGYPTLDELAVCCRACFPRHSFNVVSDQIQLLTV